MHGSVSNFVSLPLESIYEPCYKTGKAVWWDIHTADRAPMGIAGIWEVKPGAKPMYSFSMLTVNADHDALMSRFHKPKEEKRSVMLLLPTQYQAWLDGTLIELIDEIAIAPSLALHASPAPSADHQISAQFALPLA